MIPRYINRVTGSFNRAPIIFCLITGRITFMEELLIIDSTGRIAIRQKAQESC